MPQFFCKSGQMGVVFQKNESNFEFIFVLTRKNWTPNCLSFITCNMTPICAEFKSHMSWDKFFKVWLKQNKKFQKHSDLALRESSKGEFFYSASFFIARLQQCSKVKPRNIPPSLKFHDYYNIRPCWKLKLGAVVTHTTRLKFL